MKIFYFSATGNSLAIARQIASHFEDTQISSIPKLIKSKEENAKVEECNLEKEEKIGFVFPVHAWGVPAIVEEFVAMLNHLENKYIFAVATCAGTPGAVLEQFSKILGKNNGELSAGFVIREQSHSPLKQVPPEKLVIWLNRNKRPGYIEAREKDMIDAIANGKKTTLEKGATLSAFLGTKVLHNTVIKEFHKMYTDFYVEDTCLACHTCEKICPRGNIKIVDGKAQIGDNCELCFSCLNWCPKQAIKIKNEAEPMERSHRESITLKDMM